MTTTIRLRALASTAGLVLALQASAALAQSAASPAPASSPSPQPLPSSDAPRSVDEIVVTANKRTENLQNVPIVVTTVSHQLLQDTGVKDIKDLALLAPGLLVTSTSSEASTTARIRGIGTVGDNAGLESSVGIVIDGVYRPRNGVGFGDLGDVERIEILKGPQGTLFGKSATAGVINIITAAPKNTFGLSAEMEAGNYGAIGGAAEVTGPLTDTLSASLYGATRERGGYFDVNTGGGPRESHSDTNRNFGTVRGQLLYRPSDTLKFRAIVDYSHRNEECCIAVITRASAGNLANGIVASLGGNDGNPSNPYARDAFANRPDGQRITDKGVSLQADWDVGPGTLTSVTAYRDWQTVGGFDADFSTADIDYLPNDKSNMTRFRTFSQELRYGGTMGKLDYVVGGFFSHEKLAQNTSILVGNDFTTYLSDLFSSLVTGAPNPNFLNNFGTFPAVGGVNYTPGSGEVDRYRQTDNTYAVFTNENYHFNDKLTLTAGARYSIDVKNLNQFSNNIGGGAGCASSNEAFNILNGISPALAGALGAIDATTCLPFLSPGYNNFFNHQHESEHVPTGTAKLAYRVDPELLLYASYARGYKAGGFNLDRVQCQVGDAGCAPGSAAVITPIRNTEFHDETNDAFEIGEKATLLDRKLLFNVALFYQKYHDFQLNTFNGLVFVVDSIPQVISKGVDTDFVWFATPRLSFQGGLTVADTRYHLTDAQLADLVHKTEFQGSKHARLSLAPLLSASLSGTYTQPIGELYQARFNMGAKYSSNYNTGSDLDPGKSQKQYVLANARVSFGPKNGRWSAELWSENFLNTKYVQVAFDSGFQNVPTNATGVLDAFLGAPRTFGGTLRYRY